MLLRASWGGEVLKQNGKQNTKAKAEGRNHVTPSSETSEGDGRRRCIEIASNATIRGTRWKMENSD